MRDLSMRVEGDPWGGAWRATMKPVRRGGAAMRSVTLSQRVLDALGDAIMRGRFAPGEVLPTEPEREATAGSYRVGLAVPSGMARELARLARHRLPVSLLDTLPDQVLGIDRESVAEALRCRIDPSRLSLAVAGSLVDPSSSRD